LAEWRNRLLLFAGAGAVFFAAAPGTPRQSGASREPIYVFDLIGLRNLDLKKERQRLELWDTIHLVASLQGLVNRDAARLWVKFIEPADSYWWRYLRKPCNWLVQRPVERIASLEALLREFRKYYKGVVLYDTRTASASNVASTIAGVENLLCVRYDPDPDSIYTRVVKKGPCLPVVVDLTWEGCGGRPFFERKTGSDKCDAYLWAKERYLDTGRCDPKHLAYYIDAFWLKEPFRGDPDNHTLTNHDYFIARRSFFFDLSPWDDEAPNDDPTQPLGTDFRTLCAILRSAYEQTKGREMIHVGGFVPWQWKYCNARVKESRHSAVPTEWEYAAILSCYNAFMDADALGPCAMTNASFYQHYPLRERYGQNPRPTTATLRARGLIGEDGLVAPGRYILFYVGDYDSAAWLCRMMPSRWDDPVRGKIPLAWAFNPNLDMRMAPALVYTRETRTANDFFMAGDSGAGYLNPGYLVPPRRYSNLPSGLETWRRHCEKYYRRWDLDVTGFIIDGYAPAMSDEVLDAYAEFSPRGIVAQKIPPYGLHRNMPYIRMTADLTGSPEGEARRVASSFSDFSPQFMVFRTILRSPAWHYRFIEALRVECPGERIEPLDPWSFFMLLADFAAHRDKYPKPTWPANYVSFTPGEKPYGLRPVVVGDGPFAIETVGGRKAIVSIAESGTRYVYFAVHDGLIMNEKAPLEIGIEYLDAGGGRFGLQYDSQKALYCETIWKKRGDSKKWLTWRVRIDDARFSNGENGGADFRLVNESGRACFGKITVRRLDKNRAKK